MFRYYTVAMWSAEDDEIAFLQVQASHNTNERGVRTPDDRLKLTEHVSIRLSQRCASEEPEHNGINVEGYICFGRYVPSS